MVVENYRNGDPAPVYERFRIHGRMLPGGLDYVDSWVTSDGTRCFQLMRTDQPALFAEWIARWADLVDFEVVSVVTSAQAAAAR
jgi:hypothetical protein